MRVSAATVFASRFGKYNKLHFDRGGKLTGAEIVPFLLESSRVTFHGAGKLRGSNSTVSASARVVSSVW